MYLGPWMEGAGCAAAAVVASSLLENIIVGEYLHRGKKKNACSAQLSWLLVVRPIDLTHPHSLTAFLWDRLPINSIIQVIISQPLCRKNLTFANKKAFYI